VDHPQPWLKYVDAGDLKDEQIDFDGLNVESPTGEHLGDVEGFIVDTTDARPYYVVVDAGGWFKSKEFLLPIGQARFDSQREALVTDLARDRIDAFPGFDKAEFGKLSEEGLRDFNDQTSIAVTGGRQIYAREPFTAAWNRPEFLYPDWYPTVADLTRRVDRRTESVETSPHYAGRAQPGDVLGLETGGETSQIGDTAEDENERRQKAEDQLRR
jgi:hypothetical protein